MRFKVAKRDLEVALQIVGASLASSGSDISSHFTFRRTGPDKDDKYGVEVLTSSGRTFASCPMIVAVEDKGEDKKAAFTVEGWRLKQWLQFIPDDSVPEFIRDDREVVVRVKKGKQTFQSLDPNSFPYWDKHLKEAAVKATLPADRLKDALAYSRQFVAGPDRETHTPDLCVCEVQDGIMHASDKRAMSMIRVKGLEDSALRVHGKDVGGVLTFLGLLGDGDVEILEHDRMAVFRRGSDGALFGETRFSFKFPTPKIKMDDVDQHVWELPKDECQQIIGFLVAGASKEDNRLRLAPGETPGEVALSMMNATGKPTDLTLAGVTMSSAPNVPAIPGEGFLVDHGIFGRVLTPWKGDALRLGITVKGGQGFVRVLAEQYESKYLTIIPWLK